MSKSTCANCGEPIYSKQYSQGPVHWFHEAVKDHCPKKQCYPGKPVPDGMLEAEPIAPQSYWGKRPLFSAKVGTGPSNLVLVKRLRNFRAGQVIEFVTLSELRGRLKNATPRWRGGRIDDIKGNMLFISRW